MRSGRSCPERAAYDVIIPGTAKVAVAHSGCGSPISRAWSDEANRGTFQSYFSALRTGGYISEDAGAYLHHQLAEVTGDEIRAADVFLLGATEVMIHPVPPHE